MREYWPGQYHPFAHRGWWDFGTGALGDMACHTVNLPFAACDLMDPTSVIAKTTGHDYDSFPASSEIIFEFPATEKRPAIKLYWYDGAYGPPTELTAKYGITVFRPGGGKNSGALIIGENGALHSPGDYGAEWRLISNTPGETLEPIADVEYVANRGGHEAEFYESVIDNTPERCWSNFPHYAGPLTEINLLGTLAVWASAEGGDEWGEKVEWDARNLQVTNLASLRTPGVADLVKPIYREGFSLER
jgi:predicted dehydrogenase